MGWFTSITGGRWSLDPANWLPINNSVGLRSTTPHSRLRTSPLRPPGRPVAGQSADGILTTGLADELGLDLGATSPEATRPCFAGRNAERRPTDRPGIRRHHFGRFTMRCDVRATCWGTPERRPRPAHRHPLKGRGDAILARRDGLAALGPMLRRVLIMKPFLPAASHARASLAVVTTGHQSIDRPALNGQILTPLPPVTFGSGPVVDYLGASGRINLTGAGRLRDRPSLPEQGRRARNTWISSRGPDRPLRSRPVSTSSVHPRGDEPDNMAISVEND